MNRFSIIPVPQYMEEPHGFVEGIPDFQSIKCDVLLEPAVKAVGEYARRYCDVTGDSFSFHHLPVSLIYTVSCKGETWIIRCDNSGIEISTGSVAGAQRALAVLFQIAAQCASRKGLPEFTVRSNPDCDFRAVMIDLARNWHEYHYLTEYVDMCWLYGIPYLHLHFTDSQSYTLPSLKYPGLSTPGRSYTTEQIEALDSYASSRGVEIIPEIDVPGHSTPFVQSYSEIFGSNSLIDQTHAAMEALETLFCELCSMFPHSHYIHIGGDEADILQWTQNDACRKYAEECGIDFDEPDKRLLAERMLANFVDKMADAVRSNGRKPIAWEGFAKSVNQFVNHDILIESWENYYQTTDELLAGNFEIINSSWCPMYIVTPRLFWKPDEVYQWSIYKWQPVHQGSPYYGKTLTVSPDSRIRGGQLLAWGDFIREDCRTTEEGIREEQRLVEERAVILSERTWNISAVLSPEEFISGSKKITDILQKIK